MNDSIYTRTELIIGKESLEKIKKSHVIVCGIGGVGSYTLEALVRIGVGKITIIDKDIIDITNINRQLIALNSNIGHDKVEIAKYRMLDINPSCNIIAIKKNIIKENVEELLNDDNINYVVDAVDNIEAKIAIIVECKKRNIKCISCMGMGNKLNPLDIKVADIYKTTMCPLAKIMRKRLKELDIKRQKVVYSIEESKKNSDKIIGSVSFVPSSAGLIIASEVIKDIIGGEYA